MDGINIIYLALQLIKNSSFPYILKYENNKIKNKQNKLIINKLVSEFSRLVKRELVIKNTSIES